jgi:hypothetical protein
VRNASQLEIFNIKGREDSRDIPHKQELKNCPDWLD